MIGYSFTEDAFSSAVRAEVHYQPDRILFNLAMHYGSLKLHVNAVRVVLTAPSFHTDRDMSQVLGDVQNVQIENFWSPEISLLKVKHDIHRVIFKLSTDGH